LKLTFQADADLDPDIVRGLLRQEPAIDFRSKAGVIVDGTPDSEVLRIAARLSSASLPETSRRGCY
jgi:hypothetical protein